MISNIHLWFSLSISFTPLEFEISHLHIFPTLTPFELVVNTLYSHNFSTVFYLVLSCLGIWNIQQDFYFSAKKLHKMEAVSLTTNIKKRPSFLSLSGVLKSNTNSSNSLNMLLTSSASSSKSINRANLADDEKNY